MNNTGGPAFPLDDGVHRGMTLRDYFAAKAMQGMLSGGWRHYGKTPEPEEFASRSYKHADAMLKARDQ